MSPPPKFSQTEELKKDNLTYRKQIEDLEEKNKTLQEELDEVNTRNVELDEALRRSINKEGFVSASNIKKTGAWIAVSNIGGHIRAMLKLYIKEEMNARVVFDIDQHGELRNPRVEKSN